MRKKENASGCLLSIRLFVFNDLMIQPFAGVEAPGKDDGAHRPVRKHADPDRDGAKAERAAQKDAEADAAQPHA